MKLVSEAGVGTVAAGVAKAHADVILISGYDGGTGAAPLTSIRHAGVPWELGLAEAHQVLVLNNLRSRVVLETDGQLKTGRDVVIAALLGAEEFGFATAPLVALGCIMMRVCHSNTCPVGVATQDPRLRAHFAGDPEHVVNFMRFVAQEVRELMAHLGYRTLTKMVGRSERLEMRRGIDHWKARTLDFSRILYKPTVPRDVKRTFRFAQEHDLRRGARPHDAHPVVPAGPREPHAGVRDAADHQRQPRRRDDAGQRGDEALRAVRPARTTRSASASRARRARASARSSRAASRCCSKATPTTTSARACRAGASSSRRPADASFVAEENVIIGNVALYGATAGEAFVRGVAGERFCVRNSGATAVVEAIGDHGCEYMTGGEVVVLGADGRNFAAGMSGGVAFVLDEAGDFATRCNTGTGRAGRGRGRRRGRAAEGPRAAPRDADRQHARLRAAGRLADRAAQVRARDAERLPARARGAGAHARDRASRPRRR